MDDAAESALRSDLTVYLGTRGRGQWFTAAQLYATLGVAQRNPPLLPEEFARFLHELANRKLVRRWRSEGGGAAEMFGPL